MTQRKYSIDEIDRMRRAVQMCMEYSHVFYYGCWLGNAKPDEVEDQLRTHMINGTDPDDLEAEGNRRRDAWCKQQDEEEAEREAVRKDHLAYKQAAQDSQAEKLKAADEKLRKLAVEHSLPVEDKKIHTWDVIRQSFLFRNK